MLKFFCEQNVGSVIMAGQIAPKNLFDLRPDWKALLLLAKLSRRNAESIFAAIGGRIEGSLELRCCRRQHFSNQICAPVGLFAGPRLSRREEDDIGFGWEIAKEVSRLDIGQTVIVKNGTVLAVEAFEGTNEALRRGGTLGRKDAMMIKVAKPNQDMRFDVPVIGVETIRIAAEVQLRAIAVEARQNSIARKGCADRSGAAGEHLDPRPITRRVIRRETA